MSTTQQTMTIEEVEKLLKGSTLNKSNVARLMYPNIKSGSAAAKLKNKLDRNKGFRFTEKEQTKLIKVVTKLLAI